MFFRYPIADLHIHAFSPAQAQDVLDMADELPYAAFNILSATSLGARFTANNFLSAWIKLKSAGRGTAFAGFYYPETGLPSAADFLDQARRFYALGFDGIKMMDGKPGIRRKNNAPLDDPAYDPMFSYLEEVGLPVVYHVNDPTEFWDWERMPEWAKAMGDRVFYGNGLYPTKEEIEGEALRIAEKHPALKLIFAHFFFTADDLEKTVRIFETYPNIRYDITPGWEMFEGFAGRRDDWIAFFDKYKSRIFFGTDTTSGHWRVTIENLRRVLETDDRFVSFEESCHGLNLSEETLRRLYFGNFRDLLPGPPRKMNVDDLSEEINRLKKGGLRPEVRAELDEYGAMLAALREPERREA